MGLFWRTATQFPDYEERKVYFKSKGNGDL